LRSATKSRKFTFVAHRTSGAFHTSNYLKLLDFVAYSILSEISRENLGEKMRNATKAGSLLSLHIVLSGASLIRTSLNLLLPFWQKGFPRGKTSGNLRSATKRVSLVSLHIALSGVALF
jgi:hypothetical protein